MFSVQQKRDISTSVQRILRATNHPELPTTGEISFLLHVDGAESWSFADIRNNAAVGAPDMNPHNERMASMSEEEGREVIREAQGLPALTPIMDLQIRMTAELNHLKDRLTKLEKEVHDGT